MLVAQAGARQDHPGQIRVADMYGDAGGNQLGFARLQGEVFVQAGAQIHARRALGGVMGQGDLGADTVVENFDL